MCSGQGWNQLDPAVASELLSQIQEGEFWVDEEEFFREFDEITVGFPVNEEGQLQSLHTGVIWEDIFLMQITLCQEEELIWMQMVQLDHNFSFSVFLSPSDP